MTSWTIDFVKLHSKNWYLFSNASLRPAFSYFRYQYFSRRKCITSHLFIYIEIKGKSLRAEMLWFSLATWFTYKFISYKQLKHVHLWKAWTEIAICYDENRKIDYTINRFNIKYTTLILKMRNRKKFNLLKARSRIIRNNFDFNNRYFRLTSQY